MKILAWSVIVILTIALIIRPYLMGMQTTYKPSDMVMGTLEAIMVGALCGRVLGWW